ncbi:MULTISPECIES: phosphoribosyltransferase [unclassified Sinorhizobium]|uniref:phosphoribosyltransferase n=1 Tax=unclassified Sinorhizobium TaxID=2613772 RepID=UPI0024C36520|nr:MULTISPECIES: phosphoribosyltransferase [unclassified Sinorhizobium]MDK1378230.1 phosphoribosyltransferase [Sinorhizobium sp. 6-70]MDK1480387.1 phosphoribosyltransferase [Sinorhizobium sp. 6-117]
MDVHFISAYYSERAHKEKAKRKPDYWDSYLFVWAVKTGQYKTGFTIAFRGGARVKIGPGNIKRARSAFGQFIASTLESEAAPTNVLLIPVPSKDALRTVKGGYRSLWMLAEAMKDKVFPGKVYDGLRWTKALPRAHEGGGHRKRAYWKQYLEVQGNVEGRRVVLVDDVLSTGSTMLAAKEVLEEAGANVLFAITCGKTVYDFDTKPFKRQLVELGDELYEYMPVES